VVSYATRIHMMKRFKVAALLIMITLFCSLELVSANSGTPPLGNTNGPSEQNCTVCHNSFGLNSGSGKLAIVNAPREYRPGETYNIEVLMQDKDSSNWGFELTILNERGERAGTIKVTDDVRTELQNGGAGSGVRDYLINTIAGNFSGVVDRVTWQFDWTAPSQPQGTIIFYAAGVAGDRDSSPRGDRVYSSTSSSRPFQPGPPTINFLSPNHGPETGNNIVMLRGENFRDGAVVTFDGIDAGAQFVNNTTLQVTAPQHPAGTVDVRVLNTDGSSITAAKAYTYDVPPPPPPRPVSLSPGRGPTTGGTAVKLNGSNFRSGARVIFDGRELQTTFIDSNFVSFKTPVHNPGSVTITIINSDGQVGELKDAFIYEGPIPPPVVKLNFPAGGETLSSDGEPITISWSIESNGTPSQRLVLSTDGGKTFPFVLASGLSASTNSYNLILPEGLASNEARLRLEVIQPDATVTDETKKDFKIVEAPQIERISPATAKAGKTKLDLEITGEKFNKDAVVEMDGVKLKATVVSSTTIKIKKAPHAVPGSHFIRVRNPNGGVSYLFLFTVAE
jgi:large repetitive protein